MILEGLVDEEDTNDKCVRMFASVVVLDMREENVDEGSAMVGTGSGHKVL